MVIDRIIQYSSDLGTWNKLNQLEDLSLTSLIGIDWGTSSFRAYCLDKEGGVLHQQTSPQGIGQTESNAALVYLEDQLANLPKRPVLMAGMVGSTLGLIEVPYLDCPLDANQLADNLCLLDDSRFPDVFIVPGVRFKNRHELDVMRGEETQVMGWLATDDHLQATAQLCLPGTHSKWVHLNQGSITQLETSVTGELFDVLQQHSVLVSGTQSESDAEFIEGVNAAKQKDLIRSLFSVRSRVVAGDKQANFAASYLSGLLIGHELLASNPDLEMVHLMAAPGLDAWYVKAAEVLGMPHKVWDSELMTARGLMKIWSER